MDDQLRKVCIDLAQHAIGMDHAKTFRRNGEKIYLPYRNYFTAARREEPWEIMIVKGYAIGIAEQLEDGSMYVTYRMTPDGLQWLAKELRINICLRGY